MLIAGKLRDLPWVFFGYLDESGQWGIPGGYGEGFFLVLRFHILYILV